MYRLMLEDSGFPIKKMFLDIAVRDGGIQAAVSRGVTKNAYLIEVPYLPDDDVLAYFLPKRDALLWHLQTETLPAECSGDKTWDGRKCLQYCDTRDSCPHGIELKAEGAKA
jgi:hypothetical protein